MIQHSGRRAFAAEIQLRVHPGARAIRLGTARALVVLIAFCGTANVARAGPVQDRRAAVNRALTFIYTTASDDGNLAKFGGDMLWCFYTISHTSRNAELRASAARMGREVAGRWHNTHQHVPANASAHEIYLLVAGAYAADLLGLPDSQLKEELRRAAPKFAAKDFLGFDAAHEPPRPDDPNRYDVFSGALITAYFGDAYGIQLGARYRDVVKWLPNMRAYEGHDESTEFDVFYAITHLIYTLNHYHEHRLAASVFPGEIAFLRRKLKEAVAEDDPEMIGEALDCLKAVGFEHDPQVVDGMAYLVSAQRPDGTWAGDRDDLYTEYHSAWTSIDALRDYRFRGRTKKLPVN
jgi:hypothetical protein